MPRQVQHFPAVDLVSRRQQLRVTHEPDHLAEQPGLLSEDVDLVLWHAVGAHVVREALRPA
jgi:hypothetical protein